MNFEEKNGKNIDYIIRDGNEVVQYDIEDKYIGLTFYDGKKASRLLIFINNEGKIETGIIPEYMPLNGGLSSGKERLLDDCLKINTSLVKKVMDTEGADKSNTPKISYGYNGYYFYNSYLVYKKIQDKLVASNYDKKLDLLIDNIQNIYENKEYQHIIVKSYGENNNVVEVSYYDYKLVFACVNKNIYLLNIFGKDTSYPQNELVATYNMSEESKNFWIKFTLGDKSYHAVNTTKPFIKFNNQNKGEFSELNRNTNPQFWTHFLKYLQGKNVDGRFLYSEIGNLYIVYDYEK